MSNKIAAMYHCIVAGLTFIEAITIIYACTYYGKVAVVQTLQYGSDHRIIAYQKMPFQ
jgi:hypothetical protein